MRILIADDDAVARTVLENALTAWGHEVTEAEDGEAAYAVLTSDDPPPVAVLDWMMPGLEGPAICERLRREPDRPFVYILMLTCKSEKSDVSTALESGADDFVSKPVDLTELRSRLAVGLRMVAYEQTLREKNAELATYAMQMESLAEERARALVHAERLAMLGTLAAGVAHEVATPMTFISGNLSLLNEYWTLLEGWLAEAAMRDASAPPQLGLIVEDMPTLLRDMSTGVQRTVKLTDGLKRFSRKGGDDFGDCDVNVCVQNALDLCRNRLKYHFKPELRLEGDVPVIQGDAQQLEQVVVNLLVNGADAMEAQGSGSIVVTTWVDNGYVSIAVEDTGPGIPPDKLESIWEAFYTTKVAGKGTGLGLSISKGIVHDHGGRIQAQNRDEGGARFTVTIPVHAPARPDSEGAGVAAPGSNGSAATAAARN
jgi:signal transduction histidine kinase